MEKPTSPNKDLRQAFVDAARQILDEPETSLDLRKVADRVGKSRTAPYLVFGRTEEGGGLGALKLAAAASGIGELLAAIEAELLGDRDPEETLQRVGAVYIGFARRHPRLFRLMFGPDVARAMTARTATDPGPEVRDVVRARAELERLMRETIEACQQVGAMAAGDPYPLVMGAWAIFHGAAMLLLDGQLEIAGVASSSDQAARFAARFLLEKPSFVVAEAAMALAEAQGGKMSGAPAKAYDSPAELRNQVAEASSPYLSEPSPPGLLSRFAVADFSATSASLGRPEVPPHPASAGPPPSRSSEMFDVMTPSADLSEEHSSRPPNLATVRDVLSNSPALRRARRMHGVLEGSRILWIDDRPDLSEPERRALESLGVEVARATDTVPALELLGSQRARRGSLPFDAIVSDIARPDSRTAGVDALPLLRQLAPDTPVIFYVERSEPRAYTPPGAFGITNDPDELLHLLLDVLERRRM